jgi:hypothetical protein
MDGQVGNRPACAPPATALKNVTVTNRFVAQRLLSPTTPLLFQKPLAGPSPSKDIRSGMPKGLGGGTLARSEIATALSYAATHWNQCALLA